MLSPSQEIGSPTAARRSRKGALKTLPSLKTVVTPTKIPMLNEEPSIEYKEEEEEEKDSTSIFLSLHSFTDNCPKPQY